MATYKRNRGVELGIVISRFDVRRPDYSTALPQGMVNIYSMCCLTGFRNYCYVTGLAALGS